MAIHEVAPGNPDGVNLGEDSSELVSLYGVTPVAQAATVAAQTAAVTTTDFNLVLTALKNIGIIASA